MSLAKHVTKIGKLTSIYLGGSVLSQAIALFLLPVFTHYLPTDQMGIVNLAGRVMAPLAILIQLGLLSSLKSHYFRTDKPLRASLVRTTILGQIGQGTLMCALLSVAGIWLAGVFLPNLPLPRELVYGLWLMIVWGCFFHAIGQYAIGVSQLEEHAFTAVFLSYLRLFLRVGLGVFVVAALGWKGFGRYASIFLTAFLVAIVSLGVLRRYARGPFDPGLLKRTSRTGLTFIPSSLSGVLALTINAWLVNKMVSTASLGIYGIAIAFGQLIQMPLMTFGHAAYPTLAKLMSDGSPESRRQQSRLYTLLVAAIGALALGVVLFSPLAIRLLTSSAHPEYRQAAPIVPILVLAWLFQGFYWISSNRVFFLGGGLWLATATGSSIVASIVFSLLLIPPFGVYGAAMAMVGCFLVRFVVVTIVGERLYRLPWQIVPIVLTVAGMGLMVGADLLLSPLMGLWAGLALKCALLLATLPLIWATGVVSRKELAWAKDRVVGKLRSLLRRNAGEGDAG